MKLHTFGNWSWLQCHADDAPTEEEEAAYYSEQDRINALPTEQERYAATMEHVTSRAALVPYRADESDEDYYRRVAMGDFEDVPF